MLSETIKLVCKIYLFQAKADGKYSEEIKKNIYFMSSSLNFTPKKPLPQGDPPIHEKTSLTNKPCLGRSF